MVRGRPVPVRCVQTGELFASVAAALKANGVSDCGTNTFNALLGIPVGRKGLLFDPVEPDDPDWPRLPKRHNPSARRSRSVYCVETGQTYPSGAAAARDLGVNRNAIYNSIRHGHRAGGRHWSWTNG